MKAFYVNVKFHDTGNHHSRLVVISESRQQALDEIKLLVVDKDSIRSTEIQHEFVLDCLPVVLETHLPPAHSDGRFKFTGILNTNHSKKSLGDENGHCLQ